jgi:hypothetical protein
LTRLAPDRSAPAEVVRGRDLPPGSRLIRQLCPKSPGLIDGMRDAHTMTRLISRCLYSVPDMDFVRFVTGIDSASQQEQYQQGISRSRHDGCRANIITNTSVLGLLGRSRVCNDNWMLRESGARANKKQCTMIPGSGQACLTGRS